MSKNCTSSLTRAEFLFRNQCSSNPFPAWVASRGRNIKSIVDRLFVMRGKLRRPIVLSEELETNLNSSSWLILRDLWSLRRGRDCLSLHEGGRLSDLFLTWLICQKSNWNNSHNAVSGLPSCHLSTCQTFRGCRPSALGSPPQVPVRNVSNSLCVHLLAWCALTFKMVDMC